MEGRRIVFSFSCEGNIRLDLKIGFPTLSNNGKSCKSCVQRDQEELTCRNEEYRGVEKELCRNNFWQSQERLLTRK